MVLFRNDHEPKMNCIADNEQQIAEYITQNWDVFWKDIKDIEDVTTFVEDADFSDIKSFFGEDEHYKILGKASAGQLYVFDVLARELRRNEKKEND